MNPVTNEIILKVLIGQNFRLRIIRHLLLWSSALALIYQGFWYLALRIPNSTSIEKIDYCILSTIFFGSLTILSFFIITEAIQQFVTVKFQIGKLFLCLVLVHVASSFLVVIHFSLFIEYFTLAKLPASYSFYGKHVKEMSLWKAPFDYVIVWIFSFSLYYNYLLYAIGLKLFKDLFKITLDKNELEKQNLRLEYDFLKAQLNPHFLFNTLNNIYSFSVTSPQKVGDMILRLADLMRYSLYDTNEEYVELSKEVQFLESYIGLQRIRHDLSTTIEYTLVGDIHSKRITPLLLVTFLENAFKHGLQSTQDPNWIEIYLEIQNNILMFKVGNNRTNLVVNKAGGLGLRNVQKRLEYYYPKRFELLIDSTESTFSVELRILLDG